MSFMIFSSPIASYAATSDILSYNEVLTQVMESQDELKIYDEMIVALKKDVKNLHPLANDKNYQYIDGQEIAISVYGSETFDYETLLEDKEYALKSIKRDLELTALDYYMKLITSKDEIAEKKLQLDIEKKDLDVSQKKYDLGMMLKLDLDSEIKTYEIKKTEITNLENDRALIKQRLNKLMGKEITSEFDVTTDGLLSSIELDGKTVTLPSDALEFAQKNKKSLKDLEKDVKDFKDDLERYSRFYPEGTYYYKEKDKELEELIKDTDDAKLQQLYSFEKTYLNILNSINSMNSIDLQIQQKTHEINNHEVLYRNGQISFIEYNKKKNEITSLTNSKFQKILDIKRTILDYNMSIDN